MEEGGALRGATESALRRRRGPGLAGGMGAAPGGGWRNLDAALSRPADDGVYGGGAGGRARWRDDAESAKKQGCAALRYISPKRPFCRNSVTTRMDT
jgi:hypothetical protein